MANPVGRPRTVSLQPDEMIALGEEMLEWVAANKPLHISQWYSIEKFIPFKTWDTMTQKAEFIPYYEKAMRIIGLQYLDKNSNVRDGISQRWQRVYFKDLRQQEDADKDADVARAKEIEKPDLTPIENKLNDMLNQLQSAREKPSN